MSTFNFYAFPYLLCAFYNVALGFFVFGLNRRSLLNISFFIQTATMFIWQLGTYYSLSSPDEATALYWCHFTYLGATFISVATYSFVVYFLELKKQARWIKWAYISMAAVFLPLLLGQGLICGVYKYSWGYWFKAGVLHPFFLACFSFWMLVSFINLYKGWSKEKDPSEKKKRRFMFYTYLVSYLGVFDFFPDYGFPIYPFGFVLNSIFLTAFAFGISYYDLLNLDLKRSVEGTIHF